MKAFPTRNAEEGMDLRDYFAAKAMAALLVIDAVGHESDYMVAEGAYKIADAMMKAREKNRAT